MATCERCGAAYRFTAQEEGMDPRPPYLCQGCRDADRREAERPKRVSTVDMLSAVLVLLNGLRSPPRPHPRSGEGVLELVFADPGSNGFYYRDKRPDSVAAFLRLDLVMGLIERARAESRVEAVTLDHWRQEVGKLHSRIERLEAGLRAMGEAPPGQTEAWYQDRIEEMLR